MANEVVRRNQCIIGPDINCVGAGMPVGWMENLKAEGESQLLLNPYLLELTGHPGIIYTIGKHSGIPTVNYYLDKLGIKVDEKSVKLEILEGIKDKAHEIHDTLTEDQFKEIVDRVLDK